MSKALWIAKQSRHPSGLVGAVVARVMAFDTAKANDAALRAFAAKPGEDILEIGSGHGRSLGLLANAVCPDADSAAGFVAGLDPSDVMLSEARRRNASHIRRGNVVVEKGSVDAIPFPDQRFDGLFSFACLHFWSDLSLGFAEIRRVLRPGARLLIVYQASDDPVSVETFPDQVYSLRSMAEVEAAATQAGLVGVETRPRPRAKGFAAWLRASRPSQESP